MIIISSLIVIINHSGIFLAIPHWQRVKVSGWKLRITIGRITEFNSKCDSITAYVERAILYLQANDVAERKQVAVFLSAMGPKTYALLRSFVTPEAAKHKTFIRTAGRNSKETL